MIVSSWEMCCCQNYGLLRLYGQSVFPQELQVFLNADLFQLQHVCTGAERTEDLSTLRGQLYNILYWWLLVHEAKPCFPLMLAKLLKMPVGIFSLHLVQPRAQCKALRGLPGVFRF